MPSRNVRTLLAPALLAACLGLAGPAAHAGFTLEATMGNFRLWATDANGDPVADAFLLDGSGNQGSFASVSGATTTLPSSDLFANYQSRGQAWAGSGTAMLPAEIALSQSGGDPGAAYTSSIGSAGLRVRASATGPGSAVGAYTRLGSNLQGDMLLTLAPRSVLHLEADLSWNLHQDGQCGGTICDSAFVLAAISVFDGPPGTNTGGGPSGSYSIGPLTVIQAGYSSFLTSANTLDAVGSQTVSNLFFNDTDEPKQFDFNVFLYGVGSSAAAVPEPTTGGLLGAGLLVVIAAARRRGGRD